MPEQFVIGIDGGQTGTTCLLARRDGQIISRGVGPHLLHLADPAGKERLHDALSQSAVAAWQEAGTPAQPCAAAYLGLSGVEAESVE